MSELLKDVTLSVMTLRNTPLLDRIEAAGEAGFGGIGVRLSDYENAIQNGYSQAAIDEKLEEHGVAITEIEFLRHWIGLENKGAYRRQEEQILELANHWNVRHMNVAYFDNVPFATIAMSLAGLCRRALEARPGSNHPLLIQSEFMPYTPPVHSLARAWMLNEVIDKPNAKLILDTWHLNRTDGIAAELPIIPPEQVSCIQLSDCRSKRMKDLAQESRHYREIPGEGKGDVDQWLTIMRKFGIDAPLSVEVISDTLDRMPPAAAARRVADGVVKVLKAFRLRA